MQLGSIEVPSVLNGVDMSPRSNLKKILLFAFGIALFCLLAKSAWASEIPTEIAIKAIVGEAEGESYLGKVALAEALRNRGTVKGVYGVNSKRLKNAPKWVFKQAEKAWQESSSSNLVKGADHWGNAKDVEIFKRQAWFKKFEQTAKVGGHYFFKQVRS